ncbi:hypothetical protein PPTG_05810 [Phytophthora nicotianae INRA-310]|uniref:Uncharacterized protein n=1 Tax=Phytophthora nicotianae (strain INRA-310) TaxID=761204 RepID=W2QWI1_PHYN3|nr:hypothetical protein PPTG_05810 [Phytophthora nicotianae INRA-310]ETN16640.1 hypothetical protein PPTG_05810 [Phytophthora nicotianae INRA-310]
MYNYSVPEPEVNNTYTSPYLHTALLCNLLKPTKSTSTIDASFTFSFISLLHPGVDLMETILGVIGDPGETTSSETSFVEQAKTFEGKSIQSLVIADSNGNHETTSSGHLNMYPLPKRRAPGGGELPGLHQASVHSDYRGR